MEDAALPNVACFVAVPITAFRAPRAREYLETLPWPPPATLYGMLLAAVGQTDRLVHRGAELAVAVLTPGTRTRVLRSVWRVKDAREGLGLDENKRPDFQELLVGVRLAVHVRRGASEGVPSLAEELGRVLQTPGSVQRFGGLSLGESTHLVDELRALRPEDSANSASAVWLIQDPAGHDPLPIWVDHIGSAGTRYAQFGQQEASDLLTPPEAAWVTIAPG